MSHPPPRSIRMQQRRSIIFGFLVLLFLWQFALLLLGGGKLWLVPSTGIFIRNDRGTYDRFIVWPLGRGEVQPERNQ